MKCQRFCNAVWLCEKHSDFLCGQVFHGFVQHFSLQKEINFELICLGSTENPSVCAFAGYSAPVFCTHMKTDFCGSQNHSITQASLNRIQFPTFSALVWEQIGNFDLWSKSLKKYPTFHGMENL